MTWLLAFIPKPVLAGMFLVTAIGLGFTSCTVKRQAGEVAKARVAVTQAKETNDHNIGVIDDLEIGLSEAIAGRRADEQAHKTAVDKWQVERNLLEALANEMETETIEVYRDPDCAELAKLNITNICPAFVSGMRQRADRINESGDTGNTSPGTNAVSQ